MTIYTVRLPIPWDANTPAASRERVLENGNPKLQARSSPNRPGYEYRWR
jgi:hypothetical protein